ncbi:DUF262 domain-containing protein [Amycolatopsis nalaikhensis]|uniref:DUF262 domain-containing protein n=1 Tax=Amycolatopsis nalaikhensis TaxID=715472 RepID=A0ABY8XNW1_9PSEU|nr:DUF262 domain-containing protein [Amycolatopsis sp. 2-2]WIV57328.1 DUF262 domain-containing protein [Amycolatopsis sp. 2-2]
MLTEISRMAGTKIQAAEHPVVEIFDDPYQFTIPRYQRPYAWTTEQAGEMFDDLLAASQAKDSLSESDPYFLGSIVLVKAEKHPRAEVVDGQQRLTTLTVLLSVLRDYVSPGFAASLEKRIFQEGDPVKGTADQPRLRLKDQDQGFFEKYIQERAGNDLLSGLQDVRPDSRLRLVENALVFKSRLSALPSADRERLVSFIYGYTYLVVVATADFESAYRIFSVLNERGLDLTHTDILKSEIIGKIPEADQDAYTNKWSHEEDDLGRSDFGDLFSHIRMVYAKTKARESILKEFRASVLHRVPDGKKFIDDVLVPFSDAFEVVTRASYAGGPGAEEINWLLGWLKQLDNTDWVPPAISYFSRPTADSAALLRFLVDLERLAASMLVRRVDITRRVERYGRVLDWMEKDHDLYSAESPLQLSGEEQTETLAKLGAEIYTVTRIRLYVLLRLDSALSDGGAGYDGYPLISVEHVLPQSPAAGSGWTSTFTAQERAYWVHRLANLVLLSRRKNSQASNLEFEAKKTKYFEKTSWPPFVLTSQVLATDGWTPAVLEERQEILLKVLSNLWRLDAAAS